MKNEKIITALKTLQSKLLKMQDKLDNNDCYCEVCIRRYKLGEKLLFSLEECLEMYNFIDVEIEDLEFLKKTEKFITAFEIEEE